MEYINEEKNYNPSQPDRNWSQNAFADEQQAHETISKYQYELNAFLYAGFGRRFFSYIIDLLILWGFTQLVLNPIYQWTHIDEWQLWIGYFSVGHILDALIYFAYFTLMTKYFQQTLGKMILGISVYTKHIQAPTWTDVLFREWIGRIISNILFGLPYLAVIFTPKHIGVHDYFADTVVVKNKYLKMIRENEVSSRDKSQF